MTDAGQRGSGQGGFSGGLLTFVAIVATLTAVVGCGPREANYGSLGLVNVGGTITLDGQPLADASVEFLAPEGIYSYGTTNSSGAYTLMFDSKKSGIIPGPKTVRIRGASLGEDDPDEESKDKVPACYNRDSKLKAEVTGSQTINFDLKSDCSVTGPTS